MHAHDPTFAHTLELVEHAHRLTAAQARAILRTIPDEHHPTAGALARLTSRRAAAHDRLAAALVSNARAVGRSPALVLELQADLVGLQCPA